MIMIVIVVAIMWLWVYRNNREAPAAASAAVADGAGAGGGVDGYCSGAGGWMTRDEAKLAYCASMRVWEGSGLLMEVRDLLLVLSDLHEALAVCLMSCNCSRPLASPSHGTGTVVGVAAAIIPVYDEVTKGKAGESEENECWSHDELWLESERLVWIV